MRIAVYPGSFDPITLGHLDIIGRASRLFDRLIVAVAGNSEKTATFPAAERVRLIEQSLGDRAGIEVTSFSGLLVDFAKTSGAAAIVRGLRAVTDFEYEFQMALMNRSLCPAVETVFLTAREEFTYISSRLIKEVSGLGGDISRMVPPPVADALRRRLAQS